MDGTRHGMESKPPRSSRTNKKLSWPFKARSADTPVCIKPSSIDLRPPWRTASPLSGAFEPGSRLLGSVEWHPPKTVRVCRQELFLQRIMGPESSAGWDKKEALHCDCLGHWNNTNRPSSAPAGGGGVVTQGPASKLSRPKKRPPWRPGAAMSGAFDSNHGLLCDPGPIRPQSSHREKRLCKTCGLVAKPSPVLRNLVIKIENLMSECPLGWCVVNPPYDQLANRICRHL